MEAPSIGALCQTIYFWETRTVTDEQFQPTQVRENLRKDRACIVNVDPYEAVNGVQDEILDYTHEVKINYRDDVSRNTQFSREVRKTGGKVLEETFKILRIMTVGQSTRYMVIQATLQTLGTNASN